MMQEDLPYSLADLPVSPLLEDPFERAALRQRRAVLTRRDIARFGPAPGTASRPSFDDRFGAVNDRRSFRAFVPDSEKLWAPNQMAVGMLNVLPAAEQGVSPHVDQHAPHFISDDLYENDTGKIVFHDPNTGRSITYDRSQHVILRDPQDGKPKVFARNADTNESSIAGLSRVLTQAMGPDAPGVLATAPRAAQSAVRAANDLPQSLPSVAQVDLPRPTFPKGTPAHVIDLVNDPAMRAKLLDKIKDGIARGGHEWFNTEPLRRSFIDELGVEQGDAAFRRFISYVAATSPMSDVGTNIRNASLYYSLEMQGQPLPSIGDKNPYPYGHRVSKDHQRNALAVQAGGLDPLRHPKKASYQANLNGNLSPVAVDIHALRLPAILAQNKHFLKKKFRDRFDSGELSMDEAVATPSMWRGPRKNEYAIIEELYKDMGIALDTKPAQAQAAGWIGGAADTGVRSIRLKGASPGKAPLFMDHFWDRVARTAIKEKISEMEVLRRFIRGTVKLVRLEGAPQTFA